MNLTATNLDFSNLLQLSGIVKSASAKAQLENLNAYLVYTGGKLDFFIKGNVITAAIAIPATVKSDFDKDIAIAIYSDNLIHLISTYTEAQKKELIMTIEIGKNSLFEFTYGTDKVDLAHLVPKETEVEEIVDLLSKLSVVFSLEDASIGPLMLGEDEEYFLSGIENCLSFIEGDLRNNAIAIYPDRLIANDNRHIYIYGLTNNLPIENAPIALHKDVANTIINLYRKGIMAFYIMKNGKVKLFDDYGFRAEMNNSMSNILPPTDADLKMLAPTSLTFSYDKKSLEEQLKFFIGFYTNKVSYKTICIETLPTGIKLILKNAGVVGYNSSHVERTVELKMYNEYSKPSVVLITSIIDFIHNLDASDIIDFYMDNEHRAVILRCNRQEIYLPKLGEINV
jgi:hypothetical protein